MLEKLIEIVSPLLEDSSIKIDETTVLLTDLGLNSFDLIEMVCVIEDEFDISIPDKMFKKLITIKDVMDCIEDLQ
jgi:acyl carrier protein